MTDLVITAANVIADPSASRASGTAGEAVSRGKTGYLDPTSKKWMLADSNSATVAARHPKGIFLNDAALNQPVHVHTSGDITIGATLTAGARYYQSETPGGIQPEADLATGENVVLIGIAKSATVLQVTFQDPGVTL
jgi:hypothetical protein